MATGTRVNWGRIVLRGIAAGIVGGIVIHLFIYLTSVMPQHGNMLSVWQFIASTAFGKVAFSSPAYAWAGLAIHFIVSIAWATGYVYLAEKQPGVASHPVTSGIIYGFVVYLVMQLVLYTAQALPAISVQQVVLSIISHTIFFGLPVALVTQAQLRSTAVS